MNTKIYALRENHSAKAILFLKLQKQELAIFAGESTLLIIPEYE